MKIFLRTLTCILLLGSVVQKASAQCNVSNAVVQNINIVSGANACFVTFDASFNIQNNAGNKFIFIHAWLETMYPNYFECVNGETTKNGAIKAPEGSDLANAFMNLGIDNNSTIPTIISTYPPDPSVPMTTASTITKTVLPDGSANFVLTGISIILPISCGTPAAVVVDFWSSQSAAASVAHCVECGVTYSSDFLSGAGIVNCATLTYIATVTNEVGPPLAGTYNVYVDINHDGIFTPTTDTLIEGPTNFTVPAGIGSTSTVTGTIPSVNIGQDIFIVFTLNNGVSRVVEIENANCAPLPVTFKLFTAKRLNGSNVQLRWETATELNNSGFIVQRNRGTTWEDVAFIRSQSETGTSNSTLSYSFNDLNVGRTIVQYRIQQVDIDGKSKLSDIRTVRPDGQNFGVLVYPNPSKDGRISIVFEEKSGTRDAMLSDVNGRVLNRWTITNGNTITVNNLLPGVYYIRITNAQTRETAVEKLVVTGLK